MMPPPGWYPDPEQTWTWRYWDGIRWTDRRAPQTPNTRTRDPYSFSAWFEDASEAVKAVVGRVGAVIMGVWFACAALVGVVALTIYNSADFREIRSLIDFDNRFGSNRTVELTDSEIDRLGDLSWEVLWASAPWLTIVAIVVGVVWIWTMSLSARVADRVSSDLVDDVERSDDAAAALKRIPMVFSSVVATSAIWMGVLLVVFSPLLVVLAVDADGTPIALAAVFGAMALLVVVPLLIVRLSLAFVLAAIGGFGVGLRRSWQLTDGHFWGVVGRVLIAGLIAAAFTLPLSFVNSFGIGFGFGTYLVMMLVFQALSNAIAMLVQIPAHVTLARHLTEQRSNIGG